MSNSTNDPFLEYDDPKANPTGDTFVTEKYIEAENGKGFRIEVYIKPGFKMLRAHGINVHLEIDGGPVKYHKFYYKSRVLDGQQKGIPIIIKDTICVEKSQYSRVGFAFGSLEIGERLSISIMRNRS